MLVARRSAIICGSHTEILALMIWPPSLQRLIATILRRRLDALPEWSLGFSYNLLSFEEDLVFAYLERRSTHLSSRKHSAVFKSTTEASIRWVQ